MTRQELIDHITETYSTSPEYPFPRDNESCVFRHGSNRKWFALVMRVPYQTLRQDREGIADILNTGIPRPRRNNSHPGAGWFGTCRITFFHRCVPSRFR